MVEPSIGDGARAEYKPLQLQEARTAGLTVAPTLITNDPDAARLFAKQYEQVVYKPLSSVSISEESVHKMLFANRIVAEEITDAVSASAHLFQAWIDKAYEVRLTVVDDAMFAVRIDAGSATARIDWRSDYASLRYTAVTIPDVVRRRVQTLLVQLGLRFAALDLVVTPEGEWVFLEANPNGQWAWLEDEIGAPITASIADALTKRAAL